MTRDNRVSGFNKHECYEPPPVRRVKLHPWYRDPFTWLSVAVFVITMAAAFAMAPR